MKTKPYQVLKALGPGDFFRISSGVMFKVNPALNYHSVQHNLFQPSHLGSLTFHMYFPMVGMLAR